MATTTIVGDVVAQVGGDLIDLSVLLPTGADPHSFDPTPQDVAKVVGADVIFANGAGLEDFLDNLIESAGAQDKVVHVSEDIEFLISEGQDHDNEDEDHDHISANPHTWTDPNNVIVWVHTIKQKLNELDPENSEAYQVNADKHTTELVALDAWIQEQVKIIPVENRKLVTDHAIFGYFATRYGFEQIGALIPSFSTLAEPTAQDLAKIEDAVQNLDVKAVFVGNTVNSNLAERIAEDTGMQLIFVYTGSLSQPDGEAGTYLDYVRYNTFAFVDALK